MALRPFANAVGAISILALAGCGVSVIPRGGPNSAELVQDTSQLDLPVEIVEVDDRIAELTALDESLGFSLEFRRGGQRDVDLIGQGDMLGITIWENVDTPIFGGGGLGGPTTISAVQVDTAGFIFLPYAGRVRAAGATLDQLRRTLTRLLEDQTPDPQVEVRFEQTGSATVSILGSAGVQGVFPIESTTRTLSGMLATAGGFTSEPEIAQIVVRRGDRSGRIWLRDLLDDPANDIALRPGDTIIIEEDRRQFNALGATGGQATLQFPGRTLSALEALTAVGGLNASTANPTGVFVFRVERPDIANLVVDGRVDPEPQRMAYVIDLTQPAGLFVADQFEMRDGDTIYVTESPFVRFQRILSAVAPAVNFASSATTLP
ncbi:MAG: polysaccharide biosynthesis/export family protein [Pseudomonadota bacterium]